MDFINIDQLTLRKVSFRQVSSNATVVVNVKLNLECALENKPDAIFDVHLPNSRRLFYLSETFSSMALFLFNYSFFSTLNFRSIWLIVLNVKYGKVTNCGFSIITQMALTIDDHCIETDKSFERLLPHQANLSASDELQIFAKDRGA